MIAFKPRVQLINEIGSLFRNCFQGVLCPPNACLNGHRITQSLYTKFCCCGKGKMMSPHLSVNKILQMILFTAMLTNTLANHFRGGTISWKPVGGYKVEFFFKMGWTYGEGPGCTEQKIGQFVDDPLLGGRGSVCNWICTTGCPGQPVMHSSSYYCMAANKQEMWEQGQMSFNYTFLNSGPFVAAFEGNDWMTLGNGKGKGPWSISTTIDLRARSDTNKPNSSPEALSQTIYYMQYDCHHELRIPIYDPDGDKVICQWAVGDECKAVCNALPGARLNESTCTIIFDSNSANLYEKGQFYAVAITIKDYPKTTITLDGKDRKTPLDSLSSVPIQFLIQTPTFPVGCDEKPRFVGPTPAEGSELTVQAGESLDSVVAADNSNDFTKKIVTIDVMGPISLHQYSLIQDASRTNTFQKTLTWQTTNADIGGHIICARAVNERGKTGDPRCFTVKIVVDPCDKKPCQNGATCQSNKGTFACQCVPGYTGGVCETDIDNCSNPNPCQNGATCHDLVNDFSCTCVPGFTGKDCHIDIDDCSNPNPCQNGATCHDLVNDFSCTCVPGYTDKDCSSDIDDCSNPNPCQNGATCHDLVNDFSCSCVPGFTDKDCSIDIDDCQSDPCKHGGVCHDLVNDYVCICVPGFTDKNCATEIDECLSDPCINEGNCTDQVNDFTCTCPPGFTGKNCHIGVDFCKLKPCANGGICHNGFTGFTCQCVDGWQGRICDYRSAISQRATCTRREAVNRAVPGQVLEQRACCQATEYSDCKCFLSPYAEPEEIEMDQTMRDLLCALVGFPLGLGLSFLTWTLISCWSSRIETGENVQNYRKKHPPAKRYPSRTQNWVDAQSSRDESPQRKTTITNHAPFTGKKFLYPKSLMGVNGSPVDAAPHPPTVGGSSTPMNIYRASFNDDSIHSTGPKKHADTYSSGATDWSSF
ncbi:hypothetical protein RRG08_022240 [Elysia crispata]|uniref:EGF-like domain-containing protein n=1 Tax=Elysia crispata TaxID=231223 RepID=A0AAE0ZQ38_9GAST|nr:hypothetical protein RRG08_022240 [Elysia crispata]